jgi:hypothetical protein
MIEQNRKVQIIKNMVIRGMVLHSEILPRLYKAELSQVNPDDIVKISIKHKFGNRIGLGGKIVKSVWDFIDRILSVIIVVISGALFAEFAAAKALAGSLIGDQLNGFGDHLLFWLNLKNVEKITSYDMITAIGKTFRATPEIIKWMFIGFIVGFLLWKISTSLIRFIYKRKKLQIDINRLLKRSTQKA